MCLKDNFLFQLLSTLILLYNKLLILYPGIIPLHAPLPSLIHRQLGYNINNLLYNKINAGARVRACF